VARMQQWWGNKEDGLVLKVHMGKKHKLYFASCDSFHSLCRVQLIGPNNIC